MASVSSSLKEYYTESMLLDEDSLAVWSASEFVEAKLETIVTELKAVIWAEQIPRRLGGTSTGRQLSNDKKFMRRMRHLLETLHARWGLMVQEPLPLDLGSIGPADRQRGAQMDTDEFIRSSLFVCDQQTRYACTVAVQLGLEAWGAKALTLLRHERTNLLRIGSLNEEAPAT